MENYDKALELTESAYNSSGSAMEKYNIYQQSIAAQQERITALWQEFVQNMDVQGVISELLGLAEVFMKIFSNDALDNVLKMAPAIVAVTIALKALVATSGQLSASGMNLFGAIGSTLGIAGQVAFAVSAFIALYQVFSMLIETTDELKQNISGLKNEIEQSQGEVESYTSQLEENKSRIEELYALKKNGGLSIVEQEELDNLILENQELQNNINLLNEKIKAQDREMKDDAEKLYKNSSYTETTVGQAGELYHDVKYVDDQINDKIRQIEELNEKIKGETDASKLAEYIEKRDDLSSSIIDDVELAQQILDAVGEDSEIGIKLKDAIDAYYASLQSTQEKAQEIIDDVNNEDIVNELKTLAEQGELTSEILNDTKFSGFVSALQALGLDVEDIISIFKSLVEESENVSNTIEKITPQQMLNQIGDGVKVVADAEAELAKNGYLSSDSVKELTDAGYDLSDSLTVTKDGYVVSKAALDALLESQKVEYTTALQNSLKAAADLVGVKYDEKAAYDEVTNAILAKLEAQMAEAAASANMYMTEMNNAFVSGDTKNSDIYSKQWKNAMSSYNALKEAQTNLKNSLANMKTYETTVDYLMNQSSSSSSSSGSSSSSDVETEFERDIRILEHRQYLAEQWAGVYKDNAETEIEYQQKINEQVEIYGQLMERVHEEAEKYRKQGYDDESEEIQDLQKQYWEYYNARKDLLDDYTDYQKEKEKEAEEALQDQIDAIKDAIQTLLDYAQDKLDETLDYYDYRIKKLEAMRDLTQSYYDVINEIADKQHEIDTELATSKTKYEYLDETLRETIFNDDDYNKLSEKLTGIAQECETLYNNYLEDLSELTEENIYQADLITSQYEQQYNYKLMEYQVASAELDLIKAQTELQNTLANRNVRMYQNGQWTWVADPDAVASAQEKYEEAKYEYRQAQIALKQQAIIDEYNNMIAEIQAQADAAQAQYDALEKQWESIENQLELQGQDMSGILDLINNENLPTFQDIITSCGDSLQNLVNQLINLTTPKNSSANGLAGGENGIFGGNLYYAGEYDASKDYLSEAIKAAEAGNTDEAFENLLRRGYKIIGTGTNSGTTQAEAVQMIKDILASGGYDTEYSLGDASLTNADKYIENLHSSIGSSGGGSSSSSKPNYGGYDSLDDFNNAIKDAANQSSSTGDKVYIGNSGLYIDTSKTKKYDSGGVLSGLGGIKATDKDETVFDEKISSMILSPKKSKEFLDSANALTKILENSSGLNRLMQILSCGISGNKSYSDSHNIIINGDISQKISDNDYNTISAVLKRYIPITKG